MKILHLLLLSLFTLLSFNCQSSRSVANSATATENQTDPYIAYSLTKENLAVIFDIREEDEIESGMINLSQWLPMSEINKNIHDHEWRNNFKEETKGKRIFLYCRSGSRSEKVKNTFKAYHIHSENMGGYESLKLILPLK